MLNKYIIPIFYFVMFSLLFAISGCDRSLDPQNTDSDLSKITATGTQGPGDFIGNIDLSDWDPSCYDSVVFGKSFWIQKPLKDTLDFFCLSSGDMDSLSLKIYNMGNFDLSSDLNLSYPFFTSTSSETIQPSIIGIVNISFTLPDTTDTIYNSIANLKFSTGDSVILDLKGSRRIPGSGNIVSTGQNFFSLQPPYPNPTDGEITFNFSVQQSINAVLKVVNKRNEVVATIAQGNYIAGAHSISWHANLPNGNYRVIFEAGTYTSQGDIQVLK